MGIQQRHQHLLRLISEHGHASVDQLVRWLSVSPSTVRRDISELVDSRLLVRKRNGASGPRDHAGMFSFPRQDIRASVQVYAERKRAIARHAAAMCADGESVIINGGSTTLMMTEFLAERRLQVITNSFQIADRLLRTSDNEVIIRGGSVNRTHDLILSPFDSDVPQHDYDKIFIGVYGLSSMGAVEADLLLIRAVTPLMQQAKQLIVLADSSKFSNRTGHLLCALGRIDCVITDTYASSVHIEMLERAGIRVVTVPPDCVAAHAAG